MDVIRLKSAVLLTLVTCYALITCGCASRATVIPTATSDRYNDAATIRIAVTVAPTATPITHRSHFLGAFFRAEGSPPYGVFEPQSPGVAPSPYPTPGTILTGANGYCNRTAANGASIASSYVVDPTKLANIVNLGVGWTRMVASQLNDDYSHIIGPGVYVFSDLDSAQCATLVAHAIRPVINLEAGPVEYDAVPGTFSPTAEPLYKTAQDFGTWCGAVAAHEKAVFGVAKFSIPGNEVNTSQSFPGGETQIAGYSEACYAAIKAANPSAFVYGFELNMDGGVNAPAFVSQMAALGCKVGTCYDGIAMHLTLRYPVPSDGTPCYPSPGGNYAVHCVNAIQAAAQQPNMHVLISETVYPVPASVPDETTKALAAAAEFAALSPHSSVDGISYANVDECALYPTGFWSGGCLISTSGQALPAYGVLQAIALANFQ